MLTTFLSKPHTIQHIFTYSSIESMLSKSSLMRINLFWASRVFLIVLAVLLMGWILYGVEQQNQNMVGLCTWLRRVSYGKGTLKANLEVKSMYLSFESHGMNGQLGNQLFVLMSHIGMARSLGRIPWLRPQDSLVMSVLDKSIASTFPRILDEFKFYMDKPEDHVVKLESNPSCCVFNDVAYLSQNYSDVKYLVVKGTYFQSFKHFSNIRPLVRSMLVPSTLVQRKAEVLPVENRDDFKICVHIRRGDFKSDKMHAPTDPEFTRNATLYLVEKHSLDSSRNILVVFLGNDEQWTKKEISDNLVTNHTDLNFNVFVQRPIEAEVDLAFTRIYCDVTLITAPSSTFGFWLSYLAKDGAVSYYRDIRETEDKVIREMSPDDFYPPEWIKLQTNSNKAIYENSK